MDEIARVRDFRNRLVRHMNLVQQQASHAYGAPRDESAMRRIREEQPELAQEYGRLNRAINRYGTMSMGTRLLGTTSQDVVQDAIHDINDSSYGDIARFAVQHLDTVIGRLEADAEEGRTAPETIYRLTSPVFWVQRLFAGLRWLWGSTRKRVATVIGTVLLALITAVVSGWAQAVFSR